MLPTRGFICDILPFVLKNICIIGAGNIGSRHLQALAKIKQPLFIQVVDPFLPSLDTAEKRYKEVASKNSRHMLNYFQDLNKIIPPVDVAIIATNSDIRFEVTKKLLELSSVKYIIFEKLLFDKPSEYQKMSKLLTQKNVKAWVNCSRRTMPFYRRLKNILSDQKIQYFVSGSGWGLATNVIHYIDHLALLTNCYDFKVDTRYLDPKPIESRRSGFLELTGTLIASFADGSLGVFTCYPDGDAPQIMQILAPDFRTLTLETEGKAYTSAKKSNWIWNLKPAQLLNQSQITGRVVSSLFKTRSCELTPYDLSSKLHLTLFKPLLKFVNKHSKKKYNFYPFT